MLYLSWNTDLINQSLTGLTDSQRAALDLAASTPNAAQPGPVRLQKFGFDNAQDYEMALAQARAKVMAFFKVRGIHSIVALDFIEPGRSAEGGIRQRARKGIG